MPNWAESVALTAFHLSIPPYWESVPEILLHLADRGETQQVNSSSSNIYTLNLQDEKPVHISRNTCARKYRDSKAEIFKDFSKDSSRPFLTWSSWFFAPNFPPQLHSVLDLSLCSFTTLSILIQLLILLYLNPIYSGSNMSLVPLFYSAVLHWSQTTDFWGYI